MLQTEQRKSGARFDELEREKRDLELEVERLKTQRRPGSNITRKVRWADPVTENALVLGQGDRRLGAASGRALMLGALIVWAGAETRLATLRAVLQWKMRVTIFISTQPLELALVAFAAAEKAAAEEAAAEAAEKAVSEKVAT